MDSVALALFRFFSRTRQKAGAAVRAPGAAPHPHECNYAIVFLRFRALCVPKTYRLGRMCNLLCTNHADSKLLHRADFGSGSYSPGLILADHPNCA